MTKEQRTTHVKMVESLLKKYKNFDKRRISELFTGDETWVYYSEPQRRINIKQWLRKDKARRVIAKRIKSVAQVLFAVFFNCHGPIVRIPVPNGKTITTASGPNSYLSVFISLFLKAYRQNLVTKGPVNSEKNKF